MQQSMIKQTTIQKCRQRNTSLKAFWSGGGYLSYGGSALHVVGNLSLLFLSFSLYIPIILIIHTYPPMAIWSY